MTGGSRSATALVSLQALRHNLQRIRAVAEGARILAVVKANAYGHGVDVLAPVVAEGVDALGVASVEEGLALRATGMEKPVVVLEGARSAGELVVAAQHRLELVVHCDEQVEDLAGLTGFEPITIWFKIDTGMNRLGFRTERAQAAWDRLRTLPSVGAIRLMTHLSKADRRDDPTTEDQMRRFEVTTRGWSGERCVANTGGLFAWPISRRTDWVRPGLALYGASPFLGTTGTDLGLQAVMTLTASLIAIREVGAGEGVGYGGEWKAPTLTRLGIVGIGYGDGYPRHAGPDAVVLVDGIPCPVVGRVSMDMMSVDLTPCATARVGSTVVCWGAGLPVEEVAQFCGTIPWTLLCGVTSRVRLVYR